MLDLPTFAYMNPVLCAAPGLFRSLRKGIRPSNFELSYSHGKASYKIEAPVQLGCDDLRVLQAVVGLAGQATLNIPHKTQPTFQSLRDGLELGGFIQEEPVLLIEASFSLLGQSAGYAKQGGARMSDQIRKCLNRLSACRVTGKHGSSEWTYRLLASKEEGQTDRCLQIVIDPQSSVCARMEERYTRIDLDEVRNLESDPARLLHHRLCAWIDAPKSNRHGGVGGTRSVKLETLLDYVWADGNTTSAAARRARRETIKAALDELRELGWLVEKAKAKDLYDVRRPPQEQVEMSQSEAA